MVDLRIAGRSLLKKPMFAVLSVLILALGIGVNTAIFLFGNALFLRPMPGLADASRLAIIKRLERGQEAGGAAYADYQDVREQNTVFSDVAASLAAAFSLGAGNSSERVLGEFVSDNYFRTLGVKMAAGRDFALSDNAGGADNSVAIISHAAWARIWNGNPAIVGQQIKVNGRPFTIIGVAAEGFRGALLPMARQIWVPAQSQSLFQKSTAARLDLFSDRSYVDQWRFFGRLKRGMSLGQANSNLAIISETLARQYPDQNRDCSFRASAYNAAGFARTGQIFTFLGILSAMSILVLTVVCANVANLFLARMLERIRECSIRLALGGSRARVAAHALAETFLISAIGAGLAMLVAMFAADFLFRNVPGDHGEPASIDLVADWRVFAFASGLGLFCALAAGVVPAYQSSKPDLIDTIRGAEATVSARGSRFFPALVVIQIALCAALLIAASLIFRSARLMENIDPKLPADKIIVATIDPALNSYDEAKAEQFYSSVLERVRMLPGVEAASLGRVAPMSGTTTTIGQSFYGGKVGAENAVRMNGNFISPDFFKTFGISLLSGRDISATDRRGGALVVVINDTLSRRFWGDQSPLGELLFVKPFDSASEAMRLEVIGVVADSAEDHGATNEKTAKPFFFVPFIQHSGVQQNLHIRVSGALTGILPAAQSIVREIDAGIPLFNVRTMEQVRETSLAPQRIATELVSFSGATAMALSLLGLVAVMSQEVTRRTREMGIRMAIGAPRAAMIWNVLRRGLILSIVGVVAGISFAFLGARGLASILYGISPTDPVIFLSVSIGVIVACSLACYLPARRAASVDPITALRHE